MLRLTCVVILVTFAVGLELKAKITGQWENFKSAHRKRYSRDEEAKREQIFSKNVEEIMKHNLKRDFGDVGYTQGINEFSDMDHKEFVKKMLGVRMRANYSTRGYEVMIPNVPVKVPTSMDWRALGAVTPVLNQGSCGSCWTYSSVGTVEGAWFKSKRELLQLSQQNLLDCTTNKKYGNEGCDGGWPDEALRYIIDNKGINADSCYKYTGKVGTCNFNRNCRNVQISKFVVVPRGNENALLQAVANYGPVSVGFDAGNSDFQSYRSGVYSPSKCSQIANHAVTLVGYGTDNGKAYWLLKNSWGTSWGESGYFKMARNQGNMCGVTNLASYAVV